MALVSMERSKKEAEQEYKPDPDDEKYPWGLRLHLDEETMKKLGLKDLAAGQDVGVNAMAVVKRVATSDTTRDGATQTAELLITDMEVDPDAGEGRSREAQAASLYDE